MANPYHHAISSVRKWGGKVEDYLDIHSWFDASKELHADYRHRALRHHSHGIFECERVFGATREISTGSIVPVRRIGEQHVSEDLGFVPTASEWLSTIAPEPWMRRSRRLSKEFEREASQNDAATV